MESWVMLYSIHWCYIGMTFLAYYIAVEGCAIYVDCVLYSWLQYSTCYDDVLYSIEKLLYIMGCYERRELLYSMLYHHVLYVRIYMMLFSTY